MADIVKEESVRNENLVNQSINSVDLQLRQLKVSQEGQIDGEVLGKMYNWNNLKIMMLNPDYDPYLIKGDFKVRKCIFKELMRRAMLMKYMRIGLFAREFYSTDMKRIFVVVKAQDAVIARRAETLGIMKELEIGYADLISLEPVDKAFRPLKMKKSLLKYLKREIQNFGENPDAIKEGSDGIVNNDDTLGLVVQEKKKFLEGKNNFEKIIGFHSDMVSQFIEIIEGMDDREFRKQWIDQLSTQITMFDEIDVILKERRLFDSYPNTLEDKLGSETMDTGKLTRKEVSHFLAFMNLLWNYHLKIKDEYFEDNGTPIESKEADLGQLYSGSFLISLKDVRLAYKKHYGTNNSASCLTRFSKKVYRILGLGTAIDEENGAYVGVSRKRKILPTIWDSFGINPFGPFIPFSTEERQIVQFKHNEINELGHLKIFTTKDRIRVVYSLLLETCHIFELASEGIVQEFMPLHDPYMLRGDKKLPLFKDIPPFSEDDDIMVQEIGAPDDDASMENPNDSVGHSIINLVKGSTSKLEYKQGKKKNKVINPLKNILAFKFKTPLTIHHLSVHKYFGASVSLYFSFLQFFVRKVQFIGIVGAIVFFLDSMMIKGGVGNGFFSLSGYHGMRIVFSVVIVVWTSSFLEYWIRRETMFAARFNGDDLKVRNRDPRLGRYGSGGKGIDERRRLSFRGN